MTTISQSSVDRPQHSYWRDNISRYGGKVLLYLVLIGCSLWFILPLIWMVMTSFMPIQQVGKFPPEWIPTTWQFENYTEALRFWNFNVTFRNTIVITAATMVGNLVSSTLVAYGFARFRFPYRDTLFLVLLATMMLPFAVLLIPVYIAYNEIGLVNTFWPLILPHYFGNAFFIFLCRQFFLGIPQDLIDSGKIDGAGEMMIFTRIMVPLAKPAIIVIAILSFQNSWNEFLGPLIYLKDQNLHTLALGLYYFQGLPGQGGMQNQQMAATVMMVIPVLVVFFIFQKQFIQGANISGLKG
ncbi:MAG: carbohydrate ABC transporter permease [Anaerolineae bacterium]|nr:carbohydrate ABC transporter permease [Anaerolineae bacterium]